jgi:hypothetical protein
MAEHEALYIRENCISQSEDYFCEYAVIHLAKAMLTVRYLRENGTSIKELKEIDKLKQSAFAAFDEAENLFEKAMTVSPSGIRSSYLMGTVRTLKTILKNDEDIFIIPKKPLDAKPEVVKRLSEEVLWQLGFHREDMTAQFQFDFSKELMIKSYKIHEDSISLQAYHPTTHFCHAVALWDFLPIRTVATAQRALQLIKEAIIIAKEVEKKGACIYSFSRTYGEMMPAREFISHMEKSIQMIEKETGENLYELNADEIIYPKGKLSSILLTLNF